ncbi:hypothetical protein [Halobellus sp. GM3]|uniref:hypothetical protein n=1 Tax=Halobellus sp. GM3 TaxID=3458410 RepID=UPI00403DBD6B
MIADSLGSQILSELPDPVHRRIGFRVTRPVDLREEFDNDTGTIGDHRWIIDPTEIVGDRLGLT